MIFVIIFYPKFYELPVEITGFSESCLASDVWRPPYIILLDEQHHIVHITSALGRPQQQDRNYKMPITNSNPLPHTFRIFFRREIYTKLNERFVLTAEQQRTIYLVLPDLLNKRKFPQISQSAVQFFVNS